MTSLSVPGIHQARRQLEVIDANGLGNRLRIVVNRVNHPMFGKIDLSETQALLGRRIDFTIANDYPTVSAAIDQGKPLNGIKAKSRVEKQGLHLPLTNFLWITKPFLDNNSHQSLNQLGIGPSIGSGVGVADFSSIR